MIDGEVVALGEDGRPSFNALQNFSQDVPIVYYVFDVMVLAGRDVKTEPLNARRALLEKQVVPTLDEPVLYSGELQASLRDLVHSVKVHGFEGLVAKRRDSRYESGLRSGAWMKMRINRGQEFVIGGYTIGTNTFDALIFGYYEDDRLIYAARTRNGFTPALRQQLFKKFRGLEIPDCPFANLPEAKSGRWGAGLTQAKMKDCRWLKPVLVGQFEFLEWTGENHLRHTKFIGLREDKAARDVRREYAVVHFGGGGRRRRRCGQRVERLQIAKRPRAVRLNDDGAVVEPRARHANRDRRGAGVLPIPAVNADERRRETAARLRPAPLVVAFLFG